MRHHTELIAAANSELWAMRPQSLQSFLMSAKSGQQAVRPTKLPKVQGKIAVIPLCGLIVQRPTFWEDYGYYTSTMRFEAAFSRAYNEEQVGAIVIDVDSPGGTTAGVQMAADRVFATRGNGKPVVAVSNSMMCSAAYWIGSAAEHVISVPGACDIGSIGVYRMHEDLSEMLDEAGVNITFIHQPEYKVEGNPYEPLSEEGKTFQQEQVDHSFGIFNKTVARHRGVSPAVALESFGKGRCVNCDQAKEMGMIDRIATLETIFTELSRGMPSPDITKAERIAITERICAAWESGQPEELLFPQKATSETVKRRVELLSKRMFLTGTY